MERLPSTKPIYSDDPRKLAAYRFAEAARYLNIPESTLRSWVTGRNYRDDPGRQFSRPVIVIKSRRPPLMSFLNLVEAHVLAAIRREHEMILSKVRTALGFVARALQSEQPLARQWFETDGMDLFLEHFGSSIKLSQSRKLAMRKLLEVHLRRIEWDASGLARKWYPFVRMGVIDEPEVVVIDPYVSFGRPALAGTGIPTAVIADRYKAGESIDSLAEDYGRDRLEIEDAIRSELQLEAA